MALPFYWIPAVNYAEVSGTLEKLLAEVM